VNKLVFFIALLSIFGSAHAAGGLDADAQSRRDFLARQATRLAAGDTNAVIATTASMQVNGNLVIARICENESDRQILALWSHTLLVQENYAPLAQHLVQLALGEDGKSDATARFNDNGDNYRNARTLGCYIAALDRALQDTDDATTRSEALLQQTATAAGISDTDDTPPAADAPAKAHWAYHQLAPARRATAPATRLRTLALPPAAAAAAVAAFDSGYTPAP